MKKEWKKIAPELLDRIKESECWPLRCEEPGILYLGSDIKREYVFDYFVDAQGNYWYENRMLEKDTGEIVSVEKYIFGHEIKKHRK